MVCLRGRGPARTWTTLRRVCAQAGASLGCPIPPRLRRGGVLGVPRDEGVRRLPRAILVPAVLEASGAVSVDPLATLDSEAPAEDKVRWDKGASEVAEHAALVEEAAVG